LPGADGALAGVLFGLEPANEPNKDLFRPGALPGLIPAGSYRLKVSPYSAPFVYYLPFGLSAMSAPPRDRVFRVLHLEDSDLDHELMLAHLVRGGLMAYTRRVETEADFLEALDEPWDIVVSDYNMPGKSGRQLIHETAARWPHMKFILVSGYLEESDQQQIEKDYGAQILNKPFHIAEAAALVARMLGVVSHHASK
jgi:CheY-like chemotaxis protein